MAQGTPRATAAGFNSARLIRFLQSLNVAEVPASQQTFGERLSEWLGWTDASALSDALGAGQATQPAAEAGAGAPLLPVAITAEVGRVRSELARAITTDELFMPPKPAAPRTGQPPDPLPQPLAASEAGFGPYRRCYLAHQRKMDAALTPLRAKVRAALAQQSAALARLAALDAVLDEALLARERHLLSKVPGLLERHFERLTPAEGSTPAAGLAAPAAAFNHTLQTALLAELEVRLQPIDGLMVALAATPLPVLVQDPAPERQP